MAYQAVGGRERPAAPPGTHWMVPYGGNASAPSMLPQPRTPPAQQMTGAQNFRPPQGMTIPPGNIPVGNMQVQTGVDPTRSIYSPQDISGIQSNYFADFFQRNNPYSAMHQYNSPGRSADAGLYNRAAMDLAGAGAAGQAGWLQNLLGMQNANEDYGYQLGQMGRQYGRGLGNTMSGINQMQQQNALSDQMYGINALGSILQMLGGGMGNLFGDLGGMAGLGGSGGYF